MVDEDAVGTDIVPFARGQLDDLRGELTSALDGSLDRATRLHFQDAVARIEAALDPGT